MDKWTENEYEHLRDLLEILSKKEYTSASGSTMTSKIELPVVGEYGNAQEILPVLFKTVFKECPTSTIITSSPMQLGKQFPLTDDKLIYKESEARSEQHEYELFAILKSTNPTTYVGQIVLNTVNVSHWTTYVRKGNSKTLKDNKWLYFDMILGGTEEQEYDFTQLVNKFNDTTDDNVYHCLFIYLNKNHIA